MSYWQPYFIAIVIGLLVGIEREKKHAAEKVFGVRTFLLISLLGALAGGLQISWLALLVAAFTFGLILITYFTQTYPNIDNTDRGLTTEFAAGVVFILGFAAHHAPTLSAFLGPVVALILFSKKSLHRFSNAIKQEELEAALFLLLGAVVIINLVPDTVIDPWGVFNPKKFGYLILTLALLEFSSYVLAKVIGEKKGSILIGFLGGLVSSTAVFFSSARQAAKEPARWRTLLSSTIAAQIASFLELLLIVGLVSPILLISISVSVGAGIVIGVLALIILGWTKEDGDSGVMLKSPLDWRGVFRLSVLLGLILAVASISKQWFGTSATLTVSFLTGLFELQGISLANATMYTQGTLAIEVARVGIILAVISSLCAKIFFSWIIHRGAFTKVLNVVLLAMGLAVGFAAWLVT